MKKFVQSWMAHGLALAIGLLTCSGWVAAQTQYVITNDDVVFPFPTSVSFFSVGANGALQLKQEVRTGGYGIGGGYFGANRVVVLNNSTQQCVYASEALTGDIVGIAISTFAVTGSTFGSQNDGGTSNGIGLALNNNYLYASFTDSNTIGTFQIEPGCTLMFVNDTAVSGLQSGGINAMAIHGNMMIATFTDGSLESFDISNGPPVSNGDEQLSTETVNSTGATYPNGVDITSDGHYALFGDTSTAAAIEVSDISSGKLTKTVPYQTAKGINSSNIMLSPDETILYAVNTEGDAVMAAFFNASNGTISGGCKSPRIRGISSAWSYLATLSLISQTGNGGGVYLAEFGTTSGMAMVQLTVSGGTCTLQEATASPFADPDSSALLSIATYPPRSF